MDADEEIGAAMWRADNRPCKWHELEPDEQEEWLTMAREARRVAMPQIDRDQPSRDWDTVKEAAKEGLS